MENTNRVSRAAPWITRRLRVGLAWLWENKRQPRGATIGPAGICASAGECFLGINPDTYKGMPTIVLANPYLFSEHGRPEESLTNEEVETFTGLVERAIWKVGQATVLETWGDGLDTSFSLRLSRRCGRGPRQLIENHKKGCPIRGHKLMCSWDGCSWSTDGYKKARLPQGWK